MAEQRVREARKLGFQTVILPEVSRRQAQRVKDIRIIGVRNVRELMNVLISQEPDTKELPFTDVSGE